MAFLDPGYQPLQPPQRIVSLVPSQTELLYDLGLDQETVGITKFCIHPEAWFRSKARVGGTKSIHVEKVKALRPDLIIANKEENVREQVEALNSMAPVWMSDIHHLDDALDMIRETGRITFRNEQAETMAAKIRKDFTNLSAIPLQRALYLIWRDPWMTIGNDTFIHDMMRRMGLENVCASQERYPAISPGEITVHQPDIILLSSEPYPFKEKHIGELQALVPEARIILVDGEMFSWYGSRLLQSPDYFRTLQKQLSL